MGAANCIIDDAMHHKTHLKLMETNNGRTKKPFLSLCRF